MNEFLNRLRAKVEHRFAGDKGSADALETDGMSATLSDEIETFERIFAEQLARLKARAANGNGVTPGQSRQEKQPPLHPATMEPDRNTIEVAGGATQNRHAARENANGTVDHRDTDYAKQIGELQLAYGETNAALARQSEAADKLSKNFADWKAVVESKLESSEQQTRRLTAAIERVLIKVQELASRAEEQERIVARQQAEITELRDVLNRLAGDIDAKSFAAGPEAELANGTDTEDLSLQPVRRGEAREEEKAPTEHAVSPKFALPKVDQPFLTVEGIQRITFELAEVLNVMETLASLLLLRRVKALGESLEKFPLERLSELFDALASEVADDQRRIDFRQRLDRRASPESLATLR